MMRLAASLLHCPRRSVEGEGEHKTALLEFAVLTEFRWLTIRAQKSTTFSIQKKGRVKQTKKKENPNKTKTSDILITTTDNR